MATQLQTQQGELVHTSTKKYSDRPFDWRTISADLRNMKQILIDNDNTEVAALCDNAEKMICRLWTVSDEIRLGVACVRSAIKAGNNERAFENLDNIRRTIDLASEPMQPEK